MKYIVERIEAIDYESHYFTVIEDFSNLENALNLRDALNKGNLLTSVCYQVNAERSVENDDFYNILKEVK